MSAGNYDKPIGIKTGSTPVDRGRGENTPKGTKAAKPYSGAKATGRPTATPKFGKRGKGY